MKEFMFNNKSAEIKLAVEKVSKIVFEAAGIQLGEKQFDMVENRLQIRMLSLGITSPADYLKRLQSDLENESQALVSLMTTHYTYFFREFSHFEFLINHGLSNLIKAARSRSDKTISIWSAACSSGEEAYSLALFFDFHFSQMAPDISFKIYGTDIDPESIKLADNGVYKNDSLSKSPAMYVNNQFVKGTGQAEGFSKIKKHIKEKCQFAVHNLFEAEKYKINIKFDLVFCRNVFIYFNNEQIVEIAKKIAMKIEPTGYLFTGLSEPIHRMGLKYNPIASSVYQPRFVTDIKQSEFVPKQNQVSILSALSKDLDILCVDDSPTILTLMKKICGPGSGFNVKATAKNGEEALELLKFQNFDAITLDLHMPVLDGIGFLQKFDNVKNIPILVVSSVNRDDISIGKKALEYGALDYVEKPSLENMNQASNEIRSKIKSVILQAKSKNSVKLTEIKPISHNKKTKVLIVDDSLTVINVLTKIFSLDPDIEIVASTTNSPQTEELIIQHKPDVITLDINMPDIDGLTLLKNLVPKYQIPTIMISSMNSEENHLVLKAMQLGAVDFIQKPSLAQISETGKIICDRIRAAAQIKINLQSNLIEENSSALNNLNNLTTDDITRMNRKVIVIGASTGGTEAIRQLLQHMPPNIPPILIVQHIPEFFSASFADHLNDLFPFKVKEARDGDLVLPNQVLIAPGGRQMALKKNSHQMFVEINRDEPVNRHRPSVDYLFKSVATSCIKPEEVISVILTGMGNDGAAEMKALHDLGVSTIAQDQQTCVVFGMPKEAINKGGVDDVLPLKKIASKIIELCLKENKIKKVA